MIDRPRHLSGRHGPIVCQTSEWVGRAVSVQLELGNYAKAHRLVELAERDAEPVPQPVTAADVPLQDLELGEWIEHRLYDARIRTLDDVICTRDDQLMAIDKIAETQLRKIRRAEDLWVAKLAEAM